MLGQEYIDKCPFARVLETHTIKENIFHTKKKDIVTKEIVCIRNKNQPCQEIVHKEIIKCYALHHLFNVMADEYYDALTKKMEDI